VSEYLVGPADEFLPGDRRIIDADGRSIAVFNVDGVLHALRNYCPHMGAPLCEGETRGVMLPGPPQTFRYSERPTVVVCPWHHWEFDIRDGRSSADPALHARTYPVEVRADANVYVVVRSGR
jgi:3-phenylpropionate/trans-cinnamate dioxygenase ferredoxin subunit